MDLQLSIIISLAGLLFSVVLSITSVYVIMSVKIAVLQTEMKAIQNKQSHTDIVIENNTKAIIKLEAYLEKIS